MERGELVPDSLVLQMVAERMNGDCSHGLCLTGFRGRWPSEISGELLKHHGYKRRS